MGDVYAQVQENAEIADIRETLTMLQQAGHYVCSRDEIKGYLHVCKKQELGDSDGTDWAGSVGTIKTAVLYKLNTIETQTQIRLKQLQLEFDDLEKRTDDRYATMDVYDKVKVRLHKIKWSDMDKQYDLIEKKMDQILVALDSEIN